MVTEALFTSGSEGLIPKADSARQAVASLRGYAYQVTAAALAWLDVEEHARIFLEVAEDYAIVADDALRAVQVKDTRASTRVTLNTKGVRDAIASFIALTAENPGYNVTLEYFTTSDIGAEMPSLDFPCGERGLLYWRIAAKSGDVAQLRNLLESDSFPISVRSFVKRRNDEQLRNDLLKRIHWNCGKPNIVSLRKEFQERLVVIGRDRFQVPAVEMSQVADALLYRVLEKSLGNTPAERALTRADLISNIDSTTRISVSRAMLEKLSTVSAGLEVQSHRNMQGNLPFSQGSLAWLVSGDDLPKAHRLLSRPQVEAQVEEKIRKFGACFISGTSGVGKTNVARSVAEISGERFVIVDFRNSDPNEAISRLSILLSRLGGLQAQTILLEDLNCFNSPQTDLAMAQVMEAMGRRDISIIITCYTPPAARTLTNIGMGQGCTHSCPYFTEDEATQLAQLHGGDGNIWGRLAYISSAFGHPQLVHAFVTGMATRGWPVSEIPHILSTGLSSGDVDAEREAARRAIVSTLAGNARDFLYRLSLLIGQFNRATALRLAEIPPPLSSPGEQLDALVGPWIEHVGQGSYRVSPLAATFGKEMISPALQTKLHSAIAKELLSAGTIDVSDIDKIFMHAFAGKNTGVMASVAANLIRADEKILRFLAENSSVLGILSTEKPIYPDDPAISSMLRLAQFKIIAVSKDKNSIAQCVHTLFRENEKQPNEKIRSMFRLACLGTVLNVIGIANHLDNWLDLLMETRDLTDSLSLEDKLPKSDIAEFGSNGVVPFFFAIGSAQLLSIATLESIIDKLDTVLPDERTFLLSMIVETASDFSVFVNSPWLSSERSSFDYVDAAERYKRMALKTAHWGIRPLTLQCWIACAIMFDEYGNDREEALRTLYEAISVSGDDVLLVRARAKVFWRAQDHPKALSTLRGIADIVGQNNPVERAFALREAAISAAKTGEWDQAETWFMEGMEAALNAKSVDMRVMAIGLKADAAVAALKAGRRKQSLYLVGNALNEVEGIDPKSSLRAAYCHHVLRHIVLWFMSQIEGTRFEVEGQPIAIEPGCCSNPEPHASFADRPLGSADIAWYMLAEMDAGCRADLGYTSKVRQRMGASSIPPLEFSLRTKYLMQSIQDLDHEAFAERAWEYVECGIGNLNYLRRVGRVFNAIDPEREPLSDYVFTPVSEEAKALINGVTLAYIIGCASMQSAELVPLMCMTMTARFGQEVADATALSLLREDVVPNQTFKFEAQLIQNLLAFETSRHSTPREYCVAGVRCLQQADASYLKRELIPMIAAWQRSAWTRIVAKETFQLAQPRLSVPAIEAALSYPNDDEQFLCTLVLAITDATDVTLSQEMHSSYKLRANIMER